MSVKVKICGITRPEDALVACNLGVWALGFIFYPKSPRFITPKDAKRIMRDLPHRIAKVGVFVNEDHTEVNKIQQDLKLDFVQFHGDETPDYCTHINAPYIKAFRPKKSADLHIIPDYYFAEMVLIDAASSKGYGGTGEKADWSLALEAKQYGKPVILSGGLTADNVRDAINVVKPDFIDLSSGVEMIAGQKDFNKMKQFFGRLHYG